MAILITINKILHQLQAWLTIKNQDSLIINKARSSFRIKYKQATVRWNIPPEKIDEDIYIVTICYGSTRPPPRSWWHVSYLR